MPNNLQQKLQKVADFDALSNEPETTADIVKERLKDIGVKDVKIIKRENVGEIVPVHYEIKIGGDSIAFIYKPIACHSYNVIDINGQKIKVATIDTMLSLYLAFLYSDRPYYNAFSDRILCMSKFLFDVQQKNRLQQKGLLRRFSITCYGHQESVEEMRAEKAAKYKELKLSKNKKDLEEWFLNYKPDTKYNVDSSKIETRGKIETRSKIETKGKIKKSKRKTRTKPKYKLLDIYGKKTRKNKNIY
jgi:hypothetical protein